MASGGGGALLVLVLLVSGWACGACVGVCGCGAALHHRWARGARD